MKFRQIEAFRAVMLCGSASKAGDMLFVSQPAVSRLIADLEADLDLKLFERRRGRLVPTAEGELLFEEVQHAFAGMELITEAATALRTLRQGRVRVVAETVYADRFLPRVAARFQREHPDVTIEIDIGPSARVATWVAARWYDLGLVVLPVAEPELTTRPYLRQQAVCVLPADHALAEKPTVGLDDLRGATFVSFIYGSPFRIAIDRAFDRAAVQRRTMAEARTHTGVCAMVAEGAGVGVVDPCVARDTAYPDLAFRPLQPAVGWDLGLLLPATRAPSLATRRFVDILQLSESRALLTLPEHDERGRVAGNRP